jgi:ribonuclease P protein component
VGARCFNAAAREVEPSCVLEYLTGELLISAAVGQRLPRCARLANATQFSNVFERAIRFSNRAFTVLARNNQRGHARLGLAISKRCASRAVARNRIRRVVRESFRTTRNDLPAVDVVVMCRPVATEMTNKELAAALEANWQRVKQRCKNS